MSKYYFKVNGLPPKKSGSKSMWNTQKEAIRLVALRQAALEVFDGQLPLGRDIKITLIIHILKNKYSIGDLDTFVTGICDGLMKIAPRSKLEGTFWSKPEYNDIHPDKFEMIKDDSEVISIQAKKVIGEKEQQRYEVSLEGELSVEEC